MRVLVLLCALLLGLLALNFVAAETVVCARVLLLPSIPLPCRCSARDSGRSFRCVCGVPV